MRKFYTIMLISLMVISASAQPIVTIDNAIVEPCEGVNRAAIEVTVSGGISPYNFNWVGPFGLVRDTEDIYNIPGGSWYLTVYDSLGDSTNFVAHIPIASGLITSVNVFDDNLAVVEFVLNGIGYPESFTYTWDYEGWKYNVGYQDTLKGMGAGLYTLVVIDSIGCRDTVQVTLAGQSMVDTVEVIKFTEVADEATLINPVTQATIWVKNYGEYIRTSETFSECYVYDITGSIKGIYSNEIDIPVDHLETGIYIFAFKFGSTKIVQRFYIE